MPPPAELLVVHSAQQLAEDAAARLVATLASAQRAHGTASLVVTGGGILEQTLRALRSLAARDAVDWSKVSLWWGDERFVPPDSGERNDLAAFQAVFDDLPLDPANVHRMPAAGGTFGQDARAAAEAYAADLARAVPPRQGDHDIPHFDVVLLGIGPDGHCASLFPEHPGVYETGAAVIAVHNSPKPPPTRISLTFRALDAANEIWFIASGEPKAQAVAMALSGAGRVQVPAAGPRGRHRTLWLIDREAAAKLSPDRYRPPVA